jgi:hypothetical protein
VKGHVGKEESCSCGRGYTFDMQSRLGRSEPVSSGRGETFQGRGFSLRETAELDTSGGAATKRVVVATRPTTFFQNICIEARYV